MSRAVTPQNAHADPPPLLENSIVSGQYRAGTPSVLDFRPALQVGLASIVEQCLARNPANRISSAEELRLALLPFAARALPTSESAIALGAYPTWLQGPRAAC